MAYTPKYGKRKKTNPGRLLDLLMVVCLALLLVGGGMFLRNRAQSRGDQEAFRELAALVAEQTAPVPAAPGQSGGEFRGEPGGESLTQEGETLPAEDPMTPYRVLQERNPDFVAWLTVPGTKIDYPVMHTPNDIEYYIYRAFDGTQSPSGTPFVGDYGSLMEKRCVIYGHNMGDGTMFHDLEEYASREFWQENPTFTITTVTEQRQYEIFAAVRTRLLRPEEQGLRYYRLEDGVEEWLVKKSLYDTGITPGEGDSIVILSTCTYHTDNGRFVVAGRLVPDE